MRKLERDLRPKCCRSSGVIKATLCCQIMWRALSQKYFECVLSTKWGVSGRPQGHLKRFTKLSHAFGVQEQKVIYHPRCHSIRNFPETPPPSTSSKYCRTNGVVLQCNWEALSSSLRARKGQRYKWGAYCRTNWRCTAVLFRQVVGVGDS